MNRRSAILSTVLAFFGLGAAKAKAGTTVNGITLPLCGWPGVTFSPDVIAYKVVRTAHLTSDGAGLQVVEGWVDVRVPMTGKHRELIVVDVDPGYRRVRQDYDIDSLGHRLSFRFVDRPIAWQEPPKDESPRWLEPHVCSALDDPECLAWPGATIFRNADTMDTIGTVSFVELTPELKFMLKAVYG